MGFVCSLLRYAESLTGGGAGEDAWYDMVLPLSLQSRCLASEVVYSAARFVAMLSLTLL